MADDATDPHLALQAAALRLLRDLPTETAIEVVAEWAVALDDGERFRLGSLVYEADLKRKPRLLPERKL